jgi:DNA polymerase I-like protein with 3'-5' exonuclease and polymerase domains
MSVIYWDSEPEEIEAGTLGQFLADLDDQILGNKVRLDTESSGLFVDGDWKDAPPARVSAVSLAWDQLHCDGGCEACEDGYEKVSIALPFDQGVIGGKPGKWSDELNDYEILPHTEKCQPLVNDLRPGLGTCTCAPWNLSTADWYALCEWLQDKRLTFHNAKYDLHIMNAGLRTVPGSGVNLEKQFLWDTMLAQGIIEPLETSSLKPTSERLFGEDSRDEERVIKEALKHNGVGLTWRYDLLAWDVIGPYAAQDTRLTAMLEDWQQDQIEQHIVDSNDVKLIYGEFNLARTLFRMECRRVGADMDEMSRNTQALIEAKAEIVASLPFQPVNINTAKKYFFETLGVLPIKVSDVCTECTYNRAKMQQRKNTKKPLCGSGQYIHNKQCGTQDGFPSLNGCGCPQVAPQHKWAPGLDGEVAARLAADNVPYADVWVQLAQIDSALSKWYKAWPNKAVKVDGQWRLMTNFRQGRIESDRKGMTSGGAISGRLSAERIQLQGFPDDYKIPSFITPPKKLLQGKKAFCPDCGETQQFELDELDVSNAEVRVAAWLMQSKTLAAACASGNVHSANCVMMFGQHLANTMPEDRGGWSPGIQLNAFQMNEDGTYKLDDEGKKVYELQRHPQWGMYRKIAKTTVLGLFFGAGVRTLRAQIEQATKKDFPEAKVKEFMAMTYAIIPEWRSVSNKMQRKADKSLGGIGYINLVNGRKRWFGWAERTHKAFNSGTQGGVAETMKTFMVWVDHTYPGALVNQVHDSLWLELCPCKSAQTVRDIKAEGERLFTETFSTDYLHIDFELDSKRLA